MNDEPALNDRSKIVAVIGGCDACGKSYQSQYQDGDGTVLDALCSDCEGLLVGGGWEEPMLDPELVS